MRDLEDAMPDPGDRARLRAALRGLGFTTVNLLNINDRSEYTFSVLPSELAQVGSEPAEKVLRLALPGRLVSVTTYTNDKVLPIDLDA